MTTPVNEKKPSTARSILGVAASTAPALTKGPGWAAFVAARKSLQALRARNAPAAPAPTAPAGSARVSEVVATAAHDVAENVTSAAHNVADNVTSAAHTVAETVKSRRLARPLIVLGVLAAGVAGAVLFRNLRGREVPPIADTPPTLVTTPKPPAAEPTAPKPPAAEPTAPKPPAAKATAPKRTAPEPADDSDA